MRIVVDISCYIMNQWTKEKFDLNHVKPDSIWLGPWYSFKTLIFLMIEWEFRLHDGA